MAQFRALSTGASFAYRLGQYDTAGKYWLQAGNILCFVQVPSCLPGFVLARVLTLGCWQTFWNHRYVEANINVIQNARTGLDAEISLASIHLFQPELSCDDETFQPCSPKALASLKLFVDSSVQPFPASAFDGLTPSAAASATKPSPP